MHGAAAVLRRRVGEFAEPMTAEMGKTSADGRAEVEKCASSCDHFAERAAAHLAREPLDLRGGSAARATGGEGDVGMERDLAAVNRE